MVAVFYVRIVINDDVISYGKFNCLIRVPNSELAFLDRGPGSSPWTLFLYSKKIVFICPFSVYLFVLSIASK